MMGFLMSVLRLSAPMLFASLGGLFSERSGVVNIALEGFMLVGAFVAAVVTLQTGSPSMGFLAATLAGALVGLFYGLVVIHGRSDQIVAGTAFNLLVMGLIPLALKVLYDSTGSSPSLQMDQRFALFPLIFVWVVVAAVWFVMNKLSFGLWVSFAGENPKALNAAGISVLQVRYFSLMICGALAAWGGASLSIYLSSGYSRNMVAGRGFMALAALIFGKWKPIPTVLACLFFGCMEAIQIRLQSVDGFPIPAQFVQMIPYLATIFVLAGFVGRSGAPKAIGTAFETK